MVFQGLQVFLVADEEPLAIPGLLDQEVCPDPQAFPGKMDTQVNWDHEDSRAHPEDQVSQDSLAGRDPRVRRETKATRDLKDFPV